MATREQRLYPVGIQTFSEIRTNGFIYIDKTNYVYRMTHSNSKYMFLSRPRRFGKSLLTSTLRCYFEGRKELFKGLAIEQLEQEWTEYPVLHFDMSKGKHLEKDALERYLLDALDENEKRMEVECVGKDTNLRLKNLIFNTFHKTGKKVVILIDEYDAPLLDVVHEEVNLPILRNVMRNFYSPLKACDPYLRFVFMTGITKFSQLSIFSELNNIENISIDPEYAAICGISKEELLDQMTPDIDILAERLGNTREETVTRLIEYYDGYHFTWPSPDIFNPYSLMMAMGKGRINAYWFASGTPTYLIEMMRKFNVPPSMLGRQEAMAEDFDAPTERMMSLTPLLYQSGYLTIKDCDEEGISYLLDIPNKEIRNGLMRSLLPYYVQLPPENGSATIARMYRALRKGDMDGALRVLQAYLKTIPYTDNTAYEGHYQQVLYIILSLMGIYVDVEVRTATGRVDMVMRTADTLYIMELKLNDSAEAAMGQIDLKEYPERFSLYGLPIVKVGISFDSEKRTIKDWKIVKEA